MNAARATSRIGKTPVASSTELIEAFSRGVVKALLESATESGTKPRTKSRRKSAPRLQTSTNRQTELPLDADRVADIFPVVHGQEMKRPPSAQELDAIIQGMTPEEIEAALAGDITPGMRMPGEGEYVSD